MEKNLHRLKIGVLGGGQLGRMFALACANFGVHPYFLDSSKDFPAGMVSHRFTEGNIKDELDVLAFGMDKDIMTIEIENVNTKALHILKEKGVKIFPDPIIIDLIKDKGIQKQFYQDNDLPTSQFQLFADKAELLQAISDGQIKYPFVQKSRTDGYDGKGVLLVKGEEQLEHLFDVPNLVEELVDIEKELAVIVCRNESGNVATYPSVEMVFDPEANLVDFLQVPSEIDSSLEDECQTLAKTIADKLDLIGILAVEFFLTVNGNIVINEMAPRTHNSGHITMDGSCTSQFEQHMRSICNLPLGSTKMKQPGIMLNLLGILDYTGKAYYPQIEVLSKMKDVHPHIYGKKISKPKRKMGHINIMANDLSEAKKKLAAVKKIMKEA